MFIHSLAFLFVLSARVTVHCMNECDPFHNCLTCAGGRHNCASCPKGFYIARAGSYSTCSACPSECSKCQYYSYCTACHKQDRFGKDCLGICSKGCLNSTCGHFSGNCLCKVNYEGANCNYCAKGKYGYESDCIMDCPINCLKCVSNDMCTECKDGFYGNTCSLSCPKGCEFGKCSRSYGTCFQNKCKANFNATDCDKCSRGYFGIECETKCPENCVVCSSETTCDTCKDGFWGDTCQNNCSRGCAGTICLKESGICEEAECKSGFVGEKCDKCSVGKQGLNCSQNRTVFDSDKMSSASTMYMEVFLFITLPLLHSV